MELNADIIPDGPVLLAAGTAVLAWFAAAAIFASPRRNRPGAIAATLLLILPAMFLLGQVRAGWWRVVTALAGLDLADLVEAFTYALGVALAVALAIATLALVLATVWLIQEATGWLLALYRKLFPAKPTWQEERATKRRALFDTAVPQMRSSTYVVSTSPLDPTGQTTAPVVPTPGLHGPIFAPPAPRRFVDDLQNHSRSTL